jgi:hypothetical protein
VVLEITTPEDTSPPQPVAHLTDVSETSFKVSVAQNEPGGMHYLLVLPMEDAVPAMPASALSTGHLEAVEFDSLAASPGSGMMRAAREVARTLPTSIPHSLWLGGKP